VQTPDPATPHAAQDRCRFVLVQPSHPGNVGAAARAIKAMGFADLVLVQPRFDDVLQREETIARASGAADVLAAARCVDGLAQALKGVSWACATAMTPRDFGPPTFAPREHLAAMAATPHTLAFVFGPERTGLANEDVYRCHACLSIPTPGADGSLNLAQAVQLIAYEWRQALGSFEVQARTAPTDLADGAAVAGLLAHWEQSLLEIGFLNPAAPKKLMPRLQQLANRAQLRTEEVHILRGIARAVTQSALATAPQNPQTSERRPQGGAAHGADTAQTDTAETDKAETDSSRTHKAGTGAARYTDP
jgi:tRNA/rRNA methyltransferase